MLHFSVPSTGAETRLETWSFSQNHLVVISYLLKLCLFICGWRIQTFQCLYVCEVFRSKSIYLSSHFLFGLNHKLFCPQQVINFLYVNVPISINKAFNKHCLVFLFICGKNEQNFRRKSLNYCKNDYKRSDLSMKMYYTLLIVKVGFKI